MNSQIIKRIEKHSSKGIITDLSNLRPTELQSLLLYVYDNQVKGMSSASINRQFDDKFVKPSPVSPEKMLEFDQKAYQSLPNSFKAVELPPTAPIGINKLLANVDQKTVMTTIRNLEVVADPTTFLALLCAKERERYLKKDPKSTKESNFCTSHRIVRTQTFDNADFIPHFRAFALASAGKDTGNRDFKVKNIKKHIMFYLNLIQKLEDLGYKANFINVAISNLQITESLIKHYNLDRDEIIRHTQDKNFSIYNLIEDPKFAPKKHHINDVKELQKDLISPRFHQVKSLEVMEERVISPLKEMFPKVNFFFDFTRIAGLGYYSDLCFKITAKNKNKHQIPLVDGGISDWTQKLIASAKENFLSSGMGSELFCSHFQK